MGDSLRFLTLLAAAAMGAQAWAEPNQPSGIEGTWTGVLGSLRIVFNIQGLANGGLTATMDSPDQGVFGIPVDSVTFQDNRLHVACGLVKAQYDGVLKPDGSIDGTWQQNRMSWPLMLKHTGRPQEPKPPYPYNEEQVTYENTGAGVHLAGTLTWPQTEGPHPAVILISGSGQQDRDSTLFGHRPFLVLADHLTRHGIAVLRVDDRGVGGSTGDPNTSTSEDSASDVLSGIDFLKTRDQIDPNRIGLIGHSEGGLIGPMAAVRSADVAFVVLMAGPGLPGRDILLSQAEAILRAQGATEATIAAQQSFLLQLFPLLAEPNEVILKKQVQDLLRAQGLSPEDVEAETQVLTSPWYRFFVAYDPRPTLSLVTCPVLAINGSRDLQVIARVNLPALGQALQAGGHQDYQIQELKDLNHLFQTAKTGLPAEYGIIEETMSPRALQVVTDWILFHTAKISL